MIRRPILESTFRAEAKAFEIERLERQLDELVQGLNWLRSTRPLPWDFYERLVRQRARIKGVERKLWRLRQGNLF